MKIEANVRIKDGKIKFLDDFTGRVKEIAQEYEGKYGILTLNMTEKSIRYHRHKYYRGYLLPAIAAESFDGNDRKAHIEMKRMFNYVPITGLDEIPERHIGRCIIEYDIVREEGEISRVPVGYMASMGDYTDKEAKEFIMKVENFAFSDLQVSIRNPEALTHRNKGLELPGGWYNDPQNE